MNKDINNKQEHSKEEIESSISYLEYQLREQHDVLKRNLEGKFDFYGTHAREIIEEDTKRKCKDIETAISILKQHI